MEREQDFLTQRFLFYFHKKTLEKEKNEFEKED